MKKRFEDVIAERGRLVYNHVGDSMYPVIHERDLVVIEPVRAPLRVGDVPLYKRDNGQYVLHRIVGIERGKYLIKGDNRTEIEKGITDRHIIGVLTGIIRDGRRYPVETPRQYVARMAKEMLYLLACAVNEETPDAQRVAEMDLDVIYRLCRHHMLTAAAAFALEKVIPLPHDFDQAKKKAIRKLALFEAERAAILRAFERAEIRYLPLKGVFLKDDYPKSAMREMSDNDLLVDAAKMTEVREIMEGLGYSCERFGEYHHDIYAKPPSLEFEMHRSLFFEPHFPQYYRYYRDIWDRLLPIAGTRCGFRITDEDFYLFLTLHTYKHFAVAGAGLRSLLDAYVFLRAHPGLDRAYLDAELQTLGIADFEETIRVLSHQVFTGGELTAEQQGVLDYMVASGFKGTMENQEYHRIEGQLGGDDSAAAKRRLLLRRVFLWGDALESNYPFFAKHKALYPLLFVYRPVKGVITHPAGILNETKKIIRFKKRG